MLEALKFVQGAVAKKDYNPVLTHFSIKDGKIKGTNGSLTLCSPIALQIEAQPKAMPFYKAVQQCKGDTVQIHITKTGKLSIKAGKFKGLIECTTECFPDVEPAGRWVSLEQNPILGALQVLVKFIAEDASKPWALGVLIRGRKAYATNNIVLVEYDLGVDFPYEINIPKPAVAELVRVGKEPLGMMVNDTSATFMYDQFHWIRTQLYETAWPPVEVLFQKECNMAPVPEGLYESIEQVAPFTDLEMRVFFKEGTVTTAFHEEESGATVVLDTLDKELFAVFNYKYFLSLDGIMDKIDITTYPQPCQFAGDKIRGVISGKRYYNTTEAESNE